MLEVLERSCCKQRVACTSSSNAIGRKPFAGRTGAIRGKSRQGSHRKGWGQGDLRREVTWSFWTPLDQTGVRTTVISAGGCVSERRRQAEVSSDKGYYMSSRISTAGRVKQMVEEMESGGTRATEGATDSGERIYTLRRARSRGHSAGDDGSGLDLTSASGMHQQLLEGRRRAGVIARANHLAGTAPRRQRCGNDGARVQGAKSITS